MGQEYYADVNIKCPFYERGDKGGIQCEGIMGASAVKFIFRDPDDGHPLKEERSNFSQRFCETNYESCELYKLLIHKYEEVRE